MTVVAPTLADLTAATLAGGGVFDTLMRANKAHLDEQFDKGRIKGPEYASVYLGSLEQVLQQSVVFLLAKDKSALEAQLIEAQIALAEKQALLADKELLIKDKDLEIKAQEVLIKAAELAIKQAELPKIAAEVALLTQQQVNLVAEALNIPKQGELIDAQTAKANKDVELTTQQILNLAAEKLLTDVKVTLTTQQAANAIIEGEVLTATKCKLQAEYDVLMETKLKVAQETQLLTWKVTTEKAQTTSLGVDADSVIGKQKLLYTAQTDGFARDAEQKAAKIMVDSWSVQRTTDEGIQPTADNKLTDTYIGNAVGKMLTGIGA